MINGDWGAVLPEGYTAFPLSLDPERYIVRRSFLGTPMGVVVTFHAAPSLAEARKTFQAAADKIKADAVKRGLA